MFMKYFFAVVLTVLLAFITGCAQADQGNAKKGILLVAFGTSVPEAEVAIENLVSATKEAFPGVEVRLAYTSNIIRRKLKRERNVDIPTPLQALALMNDEGFESVCVQPMHVIPGEEYEDLKTVVEAFASIKGKYAFKRLVLGQPFLTNASDCDLMAGILARRFANHPEDEAIVLMGHGSPHEANSMYQEMQKALSKAAKAIFMGTVEATPTFDDVMSQLEKTRYKTVVLSPFMVVAGDHANNDMAGDEPESWSSLFKKNGYRVKTELVGLGEYPEVASLFVKRVKSLME
jgi:sirohydrochlorin cobaltochelatase